MGWPAVKNRTNLERKASILFVAAVLSRQGRGERKARGYLDPFFLTILLLRRWKIGKVRCEHGLSVRLSACLPGISDVTVQRRCERKSDMVRGRSYNGNTRGKKRARMGREWEWWIARRHPLTLFYQRAGRPLYCGNRNPQLVPSTFPAERRSGLSIARIRVFPIERSSTGCSR